jgi:hypothetical protein
MTMFKRFLVALYLVVAGFSAADAVLVFKDGNKPDDMCSLYHKLWNDTESTSLEEFEQLRDYREPCFHRLLRARFMEAAKEICMVQSELDDYEAYLNTSNVRVSDVLKNYPVFAERLTSRLVTFDREAEWGWGMIQNHLISDDCKIADALNGVMEAGDTILYLGRSPSLVYAAHKNLRQFFGEDVCDILRLDYSGSPDVAMPRWEDTTAEENHAIGKNIVTPTRLAAFEQHMDDLGLHKIPGRLLVFDIIGTGCSLNSFFRLLRHYYMQHHQRTGMPDIVMVRLRDGGCGGNFWKVNDERTKLIFPASQKQKKYGLRPLEVDMIRLKTGPCRLTDLSDKASLQDLMQVGQYYPACLWGAAVQDDAPLWPKLYEKILQPLWFRYFSKRYFEKSCPYSYELSGLFAESD